MGETRAQHTTLNSPRFVGGILVPPGSQVIIWYFNFNIQRGDGSLITAIQKSGEELVAWPSTCPLTALIEQIAPSAAAAGAF